MDTINFLVKKNGRVLTYFFDEFEANKYAKKVKGYVIKSLK
jgi:hypothetical protein